MIKETLAEGIDLYLGDSLKVLKGIEHTDHIITDPPYEARMQMLHAKHVLRRKDGGPQRKSLDFDSIEKIRDPFLDHVKRINKGWLLAFCNVEGVGKWQDAILARDMKFKLACLWIKPNGTPKLNGQSPAMSYECISTSWSGPGHSRWNGGGRRGIFTHSNNSGVGYSNGLRGEGDHPTMKPISLMRELVSLFTNKGELVCDSFMGSGSTGVAAVKLGRKFIGIEKNERYFEMSCKRVEKALRDPDFFFEKPKKIRTDLWKNGSQL